MPQNPFFVQEFRAGGLSQTYAVTGSTALVLKTTPGVLMGFQCIGSGAIAFYDATATGTATASSVSASNMVSGNLFYSNSSVAGGSVVDIRNPCSNGVAMSVSGGTFAIRFS